MKKRVSAALLSSLLSASLALPAFACWVAYDVVPRGEDEYFDTEYYKSSFVTANGHYDDPSLLDYDVRVAEQLVSEGCVLLWNDEEALPLADGDKVSLFGNTSVNLVYTGSGSGTIRVTDAVTLKDGMEKYGLSVNPELWKFYESGAGSKAKGYGLTQVGSGGTTTNGAILYTKEVPWKVITADKGASGSFASYADAAFFVLGRSGGEGGDLSMNQKGYDTIGQNYLELSETEKEMLEKLIEEKEKGTFGKLILLLNSANAIQFEEIFSLRDGIDACLWIGEPGNAGAGGIGKLLTGLSSPSGHLPDTFCHDNTTSPAMTDFYVHRYENAGDYGLKDTQTAYTVYAEGIYVGYAYYETRYEDKVLGQGNAGDFRYEDEVAFPFGFGLSYTSFALSGEKWEETLNGGYELTVTVENTGNLPGRHVVQVYAQKPYTDYARANAMEVPAIRLAGYEKTKLLSPGEKQTLTVTVAPETFRTYDANGAGTYILDAGRYYLTVGDDAHDALNRILMKKAADGVRTDTSLMTEHPDASGVFSFDVKERDTERFSRSSRTGEKIGNRFDFADLNKNADADGQTVTYLTRNDWTGTFPTEVPALSLTDALVSDLADKRDIPEAKAEADAFYAEGGQIVYGAENGLNLADLRVLSAIHNGEDRIWSGKLLDQTTWAEQAELCSNGYHVSCAVPSVGKPASRMENGPLGITQKFTTFEGTVSIGWPCEPTRAAAFNPGLSELFGKCVGEDLLHAGVTGLWGFGVNIHRTPYSGRNFEYYSEDPFLSGTVCADETWGAQSKGAVVMIKHFVANDSESQRHGNNEWMTEQTLREVYLAPFEKAFTEGGALATMTSYNRLGTQWTGGCYALLTEVLRGEWGFDGFCCSDYTNGTGTPYMNPYTGIQAGCDTFDSNVYHADVYDGYENDPVIAYCLRRATGHILTAFSRSSAVNGIRPTLALELPQNPRKPGKTWIPYVCGGAGIVLLGSIATIILIKNRKKGKTA